MWESKVKDMQKSNLYEFINMSEGDFPIRCHQDYHPKMGPTFSMHWHEHIEFHYYLRGRAIVYCNSTPIEAAEGDLVVINSNELHNGVNISDDPLEYICIIVGVNHLYSSIHDSVNTKYIKPIEQNLIMFENRIRNMPEITRCIRNIKEEYYEKMPGFELEIKSNIYHLLALLMRGHVKKVMSPGEYRLRARNLERFGMIIKYIDENYFEELSIQKLSGMMNISSFHFCRLFKDITGKTLSEYVNSTRIAKAEKLLQENELTIGEIASQCGYNDINYFSRVFRNHHNISPSKYRLNTVSELSDPLYLK